MIYGILHNKIVSQIDTKINQAVLSHVSESNSFSFETTLFKICFIVAIATIVTGITVNLYYHNLFY